MLSTLSSLRGGEHANAGSDIASRLLLTGICLPFLFSGIAKLSNYDAAIAEFGGLGFPAPALFVALTVAVQLGGALALIVLRGMPAILGALALAAFTAAATFIAHGFWRFEGPARLQHANVFVKHLSIGSALLFAAWYRFMQTRDARA